MNPKITIITICYNAADVLERTIQSVVGQTFEGLEYVIVDGGSKDHTLQIIKKYDSKITRWTSEPDHGISDAFNKGIKLATGDHILMLNAGDVLINCDVLNSIMDKLSAPIVTFRVQSSLNGKPSQLINPSGSILHRAMVNHQSTFVSKRIYEQYGGYDMKFKIRMDYDFFLRVLPYSELTSYDQLVAVYDPGVSGAVKNKLRFELEGLIAEFLNLKMPSITFIANVLYRPMYRTLDYAFRAFVKKLIGWNG